MFDSWNYIKFLRNCTFFMPTSSTAILTRFYKLLKKLNIKSTFQSLFVYLKKKYQWKKKAKTALANENNLYTQGGIYELTVRSWLSSWWSSEFGISFFVKLKITNIRWMRFLNIAGKLFFYYSYCYCYCYFKNQPFFLGNYYKLDNFRAMKSTTY